MPLDGGFLVKLKTELAAAEGARVEKVYQPSRDEIVLILRRAGFSKKLLCSARTGAARLHFTKNAPENPPVPPMFCMLLRKTLGGAKITDIRVEGFERVAEIVFSSTDELGDETEPSLVVELIGARPNIILLDGDRRIVDAVHRSEIDSARLIQPGVRYTPPERRNKLSPLSGAELIISRCTDSGRSLSDSLLDTVDGISPLIARELEYRACRGEKAADSLSDSEKIRLKIALEKLAEVLSGGGCEPTLISRPDSSPLDFSYIDITQYSASAVTSKRENLSELLDDFYDGRRSADLLRTQAADLLRLLTTLSRRLERKTEARRNDLARCRDREKYRVRGELIKANIGSIPRGADSVELINYYDPEQKPVTVPLDSALSAAANAAACFKEYKKLSSGEKILEDLIAESEEESAYIDSVFDELSRASSAADIDAIRAELTSEGYIKKSRQKAVRIAASKPLKFISPSGFPILVGRNNLQNDILTLKTAARGDIWLHTKDIHGSHVILACGGKEPKEEDVTAAAMLAAYYSKARASSGVAVDYTAAGRVKKPSGARPGKVIYTGNRTVYVTPDEGYIRALASPSDR